MHIHNTHNILSKHFSHFPQTHTPRVCKLSIPYFFLSNFPYSIETIAYYLCRYLSTHSNKAISFTLCYSLVTHKLILFFFSSNQKLNLEPMLVNKVNILAIRCNQCVRPIAVGIKCDS